MLKCIFSAGVVAQPDRPNGTLGYVAVMRNFDDYLAKFDPFRDPSGWVEEDPDAYADRMQQTSLPNWPKEVLTEWLHR